MIFSSSHRDQVNQMKSSIGGVGDEGNQSFKDQVYFWPDPDPANQNFKTGSESYLPVP